MPDYVEARSRLMSVLAVLERQGDALRDLDEDGKLRPALQAMQQAKAEIVATVAALGPPPQNGSG